MRVGYLFLLFALFLGARPLSAAPTGAVLIDRVAAVVGNEAIFVSEVNFEARLALIQRGKEVGALAQIDDALRKSILQEMIVRALLYAEVRRLRLFVSEEEELKTVKAMKAALSLSLGSLLQDALDEFGLSDAELTEHQRRRFYADRLLNERISAPLSEEEISAFYTAHPELFGGKSLREVHEQAAALAQKNAAKERLVKYVDELKSRFPVRVLFNARS